MANASAQQQSCNSWTTANAPQVPPALPPPLRTWLEEKVVPRLLKNLAALRVRSAVKLEAPTASHSPCS